MELAQVIKQKTKIISVWCTVIIPFGSLTASDFAQKLIYQMRYKMVF